MQNLLVVLLCVFGAACTHTYVPGSIPLAHDRLPRVQASAPVTVVNVQMRNGQEPLFGAGVHTWWGDHHVITQHFAEQLVKALGEVGVRAAVGSGPAPKRLDVAITSIDVIPAMIYRAKMALSVVTGDGEKFDLFANDGSGGASRALNNTLAVAVLKTLEHPGVQAYLARPVADTTTDVVSGR